MKNYRLIILVLVVLVGWPSLMAESNIVITNADEVYTLVANGRGDLSKVKVRKETTYMAQRVAETAVALESFGSHVKIDKASAPGAKPVYKPWISEYVFYDDSKMCVLPVELKKGKQAKAVFEKTYTDVAHFSTIFIPDIYPVQKKTIAIEVPAALASRIKVVEKSLGGNVVKTVEQGGNGKVTYVYEVRDIPEIKGEEYMPSLSAVAPRLYVVGLFDSVDELYQHMRTYTINAEDDVAKINEFSRNLVAGCVDDISRIKTIVEWAQNHIRYIAIEHGEYGFRPELASQVFEKRYGDCKGMSALLKAMFQAVGLDARLVWIGTDDIGVDWTEVPALSSGDHMICAVMLDEKVLYVDGTAHYMPVGMYPSSIEGQQTIIENGETCIVDRVPVMLPEENTDSLWIHMTVDGNSLKGKVKRSLIGMRKMILSGTYNGLSADRRDDFLLAYLAYPRKNVEINNVAVEGNTMQSDNVVVEADIIEKESCQHLGDAIYIDLRPVKHPYMEVVNVKDRQYDVKFPGRYNYVSNITVSVPDGFVVDYLPTTVEFENEWVKVKIAYEVKDSAVVCESIATMKSRDVPLADMQQWNALVRKIVAANNEQIVLKRKI